MFSLANQSMHLSAIREGKVDLLLSDLPISHSLESSHLLAKLGVAAQPLRSYLSRCLSEMVGA